MKQGANQGIILDTREKLAGDVERKDVAECIVRLIDDCDKLENEGVTKFSIINKPGPKPSEYSMNGVNCFLYALSQKMNSRPLESLHSALRLEKSISISY